MPLCTAIVMIDAVALIVADDHPGTHKIEETARLMWSCSRCGCERVSSSTSRSASSQIGGERPAAANPAGPREQVRSARLAVTLGVKRIAETSREAASPPATAPHRVRRCHWRHLGDQVENHEGMARPGGIMRGTSSSLACRAGRCRVGRERVGGHGRIMHELERSDPSRTTGSFLSCMTLLPRGKVSPRDPSRRSSHRQMILQGEGTRCPVTLSAVVAKPARPR